MQLLYTKHKGKTKFTDRSGGGLNENGSLMLICLNTWSSVGGTVWEGLRGVAWLEEVCHGVEISKAYAMASTCFFSAGCCGSRRKI